MIKYKLIFTFILSAFFLGSCSKAPNALFLMNNEARFEIQAGLGTIETHSFIIQDVPTFFDQFSGTVGADTSSIASLFSDIAYLRPRFQDVDLDFINDLRIYLRDPSDISTRKLVFYRDFIDLGFKEEILLLNSLVDVEDLMSKDRFHLEVEMNLRQNTFQSIEYVLDMQFAAYDDE